MSNGTVAVLGGGIAGLTAAHELALRNFYVTVYEKKDRGDLAERLGGKAATQFSQRDDLEPLPGEHGFRFFPSFYRHVVETMRRIPLRVDAVSGTLGPYDASREDSVADRLIPSIKGGVARKGSNLIVVDRSAIDSLSDITTLLRVWTNDYQLPAPDLAHLARRLTVYYFSCNARRDNEWQKLTLWDFLDADTLSPKTQDFLNDMPKALAAMDAKEGNARSILNMLFLWAQDFVKDRPADRILSGPTTKAWIEPWVTYLQSRGVAFEFGPSARITSFTRDGTRILSARTEAGIDIEAQYFICALPLDAVHAVCQPTPRDVSPVLHELLKVPANVSLRNMAGIQFFLNAPRPLVKGLVNYVGSEWGVTSISEQQYWDSSVYQLPAGCREVFSVIATRLPINAQNYIALGRHQLSSRMLDCLNNYKGPDGSTLLDANSVVHVHIDSGLTDAPDGEGLINHSPHLIHPPRFQAVRVDADIGLDNMFMAGDHVRCNTDLATMEGANETARRAVNALLSRLDLDKPCELFDQLALDEPRWLKVIKGVDERRYLGQLPALQTDALPARDTTVTNPFEGALMSVGADTEHRLEFDFAKARGIERSMHDDTTKHVSSVYPREGRS